MNLQESIRRILRENSLKNNLRELINTVGIKKASLAVNGVSRLISLIELNAEEIDYFIYQYLNEQFSPDYGWSETNDFYNGELELYGICDFLIDDSPAYSYLGEWDGYEYLYTLSISRGVINELTTLFGDKWIPIFKTWFEDNSGLLVRKIDLENRYNVF